LKKTEYQKAIDALGLSQVGASRFFGVSPNTSPRWARGETPVHPAVAKLLRVMLHYKLTPEDVEKLD
jgi:hypothetical protein